MAIPTRYYLWSIAYRDRPGGGRVHDQCALTGNQCLVVARIIPGEDAVWQQRHQLLEEFKHVLGRVRLDGDVAVLVDHFGAMSSEYCPDPVHRVAGLAQ